MKQKPSSCKERERLLERKRKGRVGWVVVWQNLSKNLIVRLAWRGEGIRFRTEVERRRNDSPPPKHQPSPSPSLGLVSHSLVHLTAPKSFQHQPETEVMIRETTSSCKEGEVSAEVGKRGRGETAETSFETRRASFFDRTEGEVKRQSPRQRVVDTTPFKDKAVSRR